MNETPLNNEIQFGTRLTQLRHRTGYSQAEFASLIGSTRAALSHYETGRREPDIRMLIRISSRFNVSLDYLLKGETK